MPLFGRKKRESDLVSSRAEQRKARKRDRDELDDDETIARADALADAELDRDADEVIDDADLEDEDEHADDEIDDQEEYDEDSEDDEDSDDELDDPEDEDDDLEDDDLEDDDEGDQEGDADEWDELDASQDWRDDGPFDIEEVDLEDDDVARLDMGAMILTPFENLQLQLQMDEATGAIQAALAMHEQSGLEIALFGAPRSGGMAKEVRAEIVRAAQDSGGTAELAKGPFGSEVRRVLPVQAPDGSDAIHVSRVWLVEGPRWVLRGTLMGEAAMSDDESKAYELTEFFKNLVIRRGEDAVAAGDLIAMTLPDEMQPQG